MIHRIYICTRFGKINKSIKLKINQLNGQRALRKIGLIFIFIILLSSCVHRVEERKSLNTSDFNTALIKIYYEPLNHLSPVRRGECPMYPSCSKYGKKSIKNHGFLKGWMMTFDRLIRCGRDELRLAPKVVINGKIKHYDPVENNEF